LHPATLGSISLVVDVFLCTLQSAEIALSTLPVWEKQDGLQQQVLALVWVQALQLASLLAALAD